MLSAHELKSKWSPNYEWKFYRAENGGYYACRFHGFVTPSPSELACGISGRGTFCIVSARTLEELDTRIDSLENSDTKKTYNFDAEMYFSSNRIPYKRL